MPDTSALGAVAALGSAASWAIGAFLFKALGEILSPLAMTLAKGACSLVILGIATLALGATPMDWEPLAYLVASGIIGIAIGDTFFFRSLQGLAPQSLLVLMVVGQVLTIGLSVVVLGERLSLIAIGGIVFVLIGVVTVLRATSTGDTGTTKVEGVIFGLLSVSCMAVSSLLLKKGLGPQSDTMQASFIRMLAGTAGVFAYGVTTRRVSGWIRPFADRRLMARFVFAVTVVTFGGFWLNAVAFKYTTIAIASTLTSTEPAFGLVIAGVFLREKIPSLAVAGTVVTLAGILVLSVPDVTAWLGP